MIQLNETEIQRFIQLQSQATPGNYAPIYKELADLLSGKYNVPVTDSSVLWLRGATEANAGRGAFSALIRSYTETQYQLRYGVPIPFGKLQDASDAVAKNLLRDLTGGNPLWPRGQMPDISQISLADATAVRDFLFGPELGHQDTDTAFSQNSAWSGSLLFSLLRSDQTSRLMQGGGDPAKIDTLNDWRDVLYAHKSYEAGLKAAVTGSAATLLIAQTGSPDQRAQAATTIATDTLVMGATLAALPSLPSIGFSWNQAIVNLTSNPTLKEAFKVIGDVGQNKFLDMLMGAVQGKPLLGTTTDTNFQANIQAFFGALSPAQLQAVDAKQMPLNSDELASLGRQDVYARAALAALSVVSVKVGTEVAERFRLYDSTTGQGNITQDWIVDRAAFTANYYKKLQGLGGIVNGSENARYYDAATNTEVLVGAGSAQRKQFIFGAATDDTQVGQGFNDHLYGGAGNDSLEGKGGNDYLEGGTGNDTYVVESNSGRDIVFDIDGLGRIQLDGDTLTGGAQFGDNRVYRSADKKHLYVLANASESTLLIDGQIVVESYNKTRGDLGITYSDAPLLGNPTTTLDIKGDLKPQNFGTEQSPRYETDPLTGNILASKEADPDRIDTLYDSAGNDHITSGGGNDVVYTTKGGDNWVEATHRSLSCVA